MKPENISHKQLVELIANSSGYNQYEVQDILLHLACNLQEAIKEGYTVRVKGLGDFYTKKPYTRKFRSAMLDKEVEVTTKVTPILKGDIYMLNYLNGEYSERELTVEESSEDFIDKPEN